MVPKTLSDRDAVVQFEAGMFPAVSEIQWDASREARRWSSRCKPETQPPFAPPGKWPRANALLFGASASSG